MINPHTITIAGVTFDNVNYDAEAEAELHIGVATSMRSEKRLERHASQWGDSVWVGCRLKNVSDVTNQHQDRTTEFVLSFEEWAEARKHCPPPTDDDVTITWDGRAINTKEKVLAWLKEVDANHQVGITYEQLSKRPEANWHQVDWDWDPVADPRA